MAGETARGAAWLTVLPLWKLGDHSVAPPWKPALTPSQARGLPCGGGGHFLKQSSVVCRLSPVVLLKSIPSAENTIYWGSICLSR